MVKSEVFGTRPSKLDGFIAQRKWKMYNKKLYFAACIYKVNKNPETRYLMILDYKNYDLFEIDVTPNILLKFFKVIVSKFYYQDEKNIFIKHSCQKKIIKGNIDTIRDSIINITKCEYKERPGETKKEGVSGFFRKYMGGNYCFIDFDFILLNKNKKLFIVEEKTFSKDNYILIGEGQYISFQEIIKDLRINKNVKLLIVYVHSDDHDVSEKDDVYFYDVDLKGLPKRESERIEEWGQMTKIPINEFKVMKIKEFLEMISNS
ncbi:MAG TPA: hypothetical protein P5140_04770 [Methanofastidiosum sp.]|nr:hypothetical protein [Methanofastidiosum sp.]HRS25845.1 hypothetical protein [Methanofastidiosum sp.]